jgi:hypothetical protein
MRARRCGQSYHVPVTTSTNRERNSVKALPIIAAIAFYKNNGFSLVETTDGSDNEEGEPDARYSWNAQ